MTTPGMLQRPAALLALLVIGQALFALAAWTLGHWRLATFGEGYVPMAPITAVLFLLLGLKQLARMCWPDERASRLFRLVALSATSLVSVVVLVASWSAASLPWDRWFVTEEERSLAVPIGRMSALTGLAFLLSVAGFWGERMGSATRPGVRWAVLAATAGLLLGMVVAIAYSAGAPLLYGGQGVPMALLTAFSFIALNLSTLTSGPMTAAPEPPLTHTSDRRLSDEARRFGRRLRLGAFAGAGTLLALGLPYFRFEQNAARGVIQANLDNVADLKAGEVRRWREERLAEGRFLMQASFVAEDIAALVARPDDPANRSRVLGWLEPIKGGDRYSAAVVFDMLGNVLAAAPDSAGPRPDILAHSRAAIDQQDSVLVDLHRHDETGSVHMDLLVPVFAPLAPGTAADSRPIPLALILLQVNAEKILFPMVQRWPTPSDSAEAVLVRREGDEVLHLDELRHSPGTSLAMRRSIHEPSLPGAMAVRGESGVRMARDYRGVAVLSASRAIPGSPWFLVAKIDLAEVYAPVRRQMWRNGALLTLLLGGFWVGVAVVWGQHQADYLRREIAARALHERQVERLTRLYAALSHVNQAIVRSTRREDIFQEVCRVLVEFGRFRMVWIGWRNPATDAVDNVADFGDDTGYLKELRVYADERPEGQGPTGTAIRENRTYVCNDFLADSRTAPWRAAAARAGIRASIALPLRVESRAVGTLTAYATEPGFFGAEEVALLEETAADIAYALDILEKEARRQEAESALYASEARFRSLFESSMDGILLTTANGEILAANPAACRMLGRTEPEIRQAGINRLLAEHGPTGRVAGELTLVRGNGTTFEAEFSSSAFDTPEGARMSLSFRDITARKQADAKLEAQLGELRRWYAVTVDRESRVLDLKHEVNLLLGRLGEPPRYASSEPVGAETARDSPPKERGRT